MMTGLIGTLVCWGIGRVVAHVAAAGRRDRRGGQARARDRRLVGDWPRAGAGARARGAHVTVAARRRERLDELVREIAAAGGTAEALDPRRRRRRRHVRGGARGRRPAAARLRRRQRGQGGITPGKKLDWARVKTILETNLVGAAAAIAGAVPGMIARGDGRVVAVASVAGFRGLPRFGAYSASKAGLITLCESLRIDLHGTGRLGHHGVPGLRADRAVDAGQDAPVRRPRRRGGGDASCAPPTRATRSARSPRRSSPECARRSCCRGRCTNIATRTKVKY